MAHSIHRPARLATAMPDDELIDRHWRSAFAYGRDVIAQAGSVTEPRPGVLATIVPSAPEVAIANVILYRDAEAMSDALLDELQDAHVAAGARRWLVWMHPGHEALGERLAARGHIPVERPLMVGSELRDMDLTPRRELDLDPEPSWATVGRINDLAYEGAPGTSRWLEAIPDDDRTRLWVARVDGVPAVSIVVHRDGDNCYAFYGAVIARFRGRGLASELLRAALRAERDAGALTTTTGDSSRAGEAIWRYMGYRSLGRLVWWEGRARSS
jgi:GNAT superfamily N-acetyltransferase